VAGSTDVDGLAVPPVPVKWFDFMKLIDVLCPCIAYNHFISRRRIKYKSNMCCT
jgi:hypothetical protein